MIFELNLFSSMLLGFIGGMLRAFQGAYKDTPWEEFSIVKLFRSIFLGIFCGAAWFYILRTLGFEIHPGIFITLTVFMETIITEMYKRGIRVEDLSKYKMPTIFHINGTIIKNRFHRILIIIFVVSLLFALFFVSAYFDRIMFFWNRLFWGLFWGLIGGLMVSIGGALLDTAWEGFFPLKFFRSALLGGYWGVLFSFYVSQAPILVFACIGMDRMSLEFYKSFIRKSKSGKFKSERPTNKVWIEKREKLVNFYMIPWFIFMFLMVAF